MVKLSGYLGSTMEIKSLLFLGMASAQSQLSSSKAGGYAVPNVPINRYLQAQYGTDFSSNSTMEAVKPSSDTAMEAFKPSSDTATDR